MDMEIRSARFTRVAEIGGRQFGEVEAVTDDGRTFVVKLGLEADGTCGVHSVLEKNASTEIDWYDNNLHQAYRDVTEQVTGGDGAGKTGDFAASVLRFEDVADRLAAHLGAGGVPDGTGGAGGNPDRIFPTL